MYIERPRKADVGLDPVERWTIGEHAELSGFIPETFDNPNIPPVVGGDAQLRFLERLQQRVAANHSVTSWEIFYD